MRKDGYVVVQPWMVTDYNLNGNKLLIYALIWGFSQDEQSCFYGSVSYVVEYFKLSKRAVLNLLAELEKDGLIRKWTEPVNGRPTNRYAALRPAACASASDGCKKCTGEENAPVNNVHSDGCKSAPLPVQNVHPRKKIIIKARIKGRPQLVFHRLRWNRSERTSGSVVSRLLMLRPRLTSSLIGTRLTGGSWVKPK